MPTMCMSTPGPSNLGQRALWLSISRRPVIGAQRPARFVHAASTRTTYTLGRTALDFILSAASQHLHRQPVVPKAICAAFWCLQRESEQWRFEYETERIFCSVPTNAAWLDQLAGGSCVSSRQLEVSDSAADARGNCPDSGHRWPIEQPRLASGCWPSHSNRKTLRRVLAQLPARPLCRHSRHTALNQRSIQQPLPLVLQGFNLALHEPRAWRLSEPTSHTAGQPWPRPDGQR